MEHEVFVPVPAERLREALADPVRVARAVPGLQQDAGTPPVSGRLKVRVSGHTITYRGALRVTAQDDGTYAVEGDATEARGTGSVKLALAVHLRATDGGTTLTFTGTASGDGRVAELPPDAVSSSGARLLSRFAENLGAEGEREPQPDAAVEPESRAEPEPEPGAVALPEFRDESEPDVVAESEASAESESESESEPESESESESESVFEVEVPAPSLDSLEDDELVEEEFVVEAGEPGEEDAMAEAAHARRTMIGRSAEEVDHAPPRGRYAPVPPPEATAARDTLRWAAPAAALALASAIALTRALRKRR
ncbi:SRPBCC domain-containing protein [Streptomyces sp. NBC_00996]|uniref:SRPBCC domain-containing protein n=1 Tax=Streptomyces sp. NBC_00996 TaxID=2903710 RepID=UPI0038683BD9|nr:SRPBCC domain-containing protein [Streptomyces sp. NBC_00996]